MNALFDCHYAQTARFDRIDGGGGRSRVCHYSKDLASPIHTHDDSAINNITTTEKPVERISTKKSAKIVQ